MQFTYHAYSDLPELLTINGYAFRDYHNYPGAPRCVILRHDIDTSLEQAVRLAEEKFDRAATYGELIRVMTEKEECCP